MDKLYNVRQHVSVIVPEDKEKEIPAHVEFTWAVLGYNYTWAQAKEMRKKNRRSQIFPQPEFWEFDRSEEPEKNPTLPAEPLPVDPEIPEVQV